MLVQGTSYLSPCESRAQLNMVSPEVLDPGFVEDEMKELSGGHVGMFLRVGAGLVVIVGRRRRRLAVLVTRQGIRRSEDHSEDRQRDDESVSQKSFHG